MQFVVYLAVLLTTVFAVALEWDTLVQPSPATRHAMHRVVTLHVPPNPATPPATPSLPPRDVAKVPVAYPAPAAPSDQPDTAQAQAPAPRCDVNACAGAYISFRASDCTWQPYEGPRRLCTKGAVAEATAAGANASAEPAATPCHLRACAEHYSSFNPSDCTYQPLDGPRRHCEK